MLRDDLVTRLRARLEGEPEELIAAYLFGSVARGEERADSDVDLGLLYRRSPARTLAGPSERLVNALERELGRTVDAVVLNNAPPDLVQRVLRDGEVLLDRAPSARLAFEVRLRNEFFDLQPILDLYRRAGRSTG